MVLLGRWNLLQQKCRGSREGLLALDHPHSVATSSECARTPAALLRDALHLRPVAVLVGTNANRKAFARYHTSAYVEQERLKIMKFLNKYLSLVQHSEKVVPYRMNVVAIVDGLNKSPTDPKNSWSHGASFVMDNVKQDRVKQEVRHISIPVT